MKFKLLEINDDHEFASAIEGKRVLGIDESGVGDYFTPLTAAVAIVSDAAIPRLEELGVTDSKKMSDNKIRVVSKIIKEEELAKFQTAFISPKGYNRLAKYGNNANHIKMFVHLKAFTDSQTNSKKHKPIQAKDFDLVLIDQYSTKNAIEGYFDHFFEKKDRRGKTNWANFRRFGTPVVLSQKAESKHLSVAVASILARNLLLEKMDEYNSEWNETLPLGNSTKTKEFAENFIIERAKDPETKKRDEKAERILRSIIIKNFDLFRIQKEKAAEKALKEKEKLELEKQAN